MLSQCTRICKYNLNICFKIITPLHYYTDMCNFQFHLFLCCRLNVITPFLTLTRFVTINLALMWIAYSKSEFRSNFQDFHGFKPMLKGRICTHLMLELLHLNIVQVYFHKSLYSLCYRLTLHGVEIHVRFKEGTSKWQHCNSGLTCAR